MKKYHKVYRRHIVLWSFQITVNMNNAQKLWFSKVLYDIFATVKISKFVRRQRTYLSLQVRVTNIRIIANKYSNQSNGIPMLLKRAAPLTKVSQLHNQIIY